MNFKENSEKMKKMTNLAMQMLKIQKKSFISIIRDLVECRKSREKNEILRFIVSH